MLSTSLPKKRLIGLLLFAVIVALVFAFNRFHKPGQSTIFADVSASAAVDFRHTEHDGELIPTGGGVVVLDFDGDGFEDIYVPVSNGSNALLRNKGDGSFEEVSARAGVQDRLERGNGGCAADYDNDGDADLYVTNYGASKLFRNNGDATFSDVTLSAGLDNTDDFSRSTGCAWGDYDGDGYLDMIVVRHFDEPDYLEMLADKDFTAGVRHLELYRGNGDGTFSSVTSILGDTSTSAGLYGGPGGNVWGAGFQPGWVDFDNDGDLDLYVVNDFGDLIQSNVLWRNDGPGSDGSWQFLDVSAVSGAGVPMNGMGLAVGDYDLDGFLDLFVTNMADNVLLRNNGDGLTFTDVAIDAGVGMWILGEDERVAWGAVFIDYDNDGDEDLYVVSGYLRLPGSELYQLPTYLVEQPNVLLRNEGDGTFANVSVLSGADDAGVGRGGVYLDFNHDGCLDLYVVNLGQEARLFQNLCDTSNSWLIIVTEGTISNRDGIGARIEVSAGGTTQIREVSGGSSQMGQNMLPVHFGLGGAGQVDTVTVRWPSGAVQTLSDVAVNQRLTVTEPR